MGYRFNHQIKVGLDPSKSLETRRWAVWRCSSLISNLTTNALSDNEVYALISKKIDFCSDKVPLKKDLPTENEIIKAISLLIQIRFRLIHTLHIYENRRRKHKNLAERFPVPRAFSKEDVTDIINSSTSFIFKP